MEHAKTKAHKDAKKLYSGKKDTIEDGMNRCRATTYKAITNLFGGAYVIAKHNLFFNTYRVMLELLKFCKCHAITKDLYHGDKACKTFVKFISEALL